jgi:hypothetical protein
MLWMTAYTSSTTIRRKAPRSRKVGSRSLIAPRDATVGRDTYQEAYYADDGYETHETQEREAHTNVERTLHFAVLLVLPGCA